MIRDVGLSFQVLGLLHLTIIPLTLIAAALWLKPRYGLSDASAFGLGAIVSGVVTFGLFILLSARSDRGMGILVLLLYPALEALLVISGLVALAIHGVRKASGIKGRDSDASFGEDGAARAESGDREAAGRRDGRNDDPHSD